MEDILNSRPITPVSQCPRDVDALTPNHLLLLQPGSSLPCGVFDSTDNYPRRRWRQVQFLADLFWRRWKTEYLHLLQERQKWHTSQRNLCIGDIVLVMDSARNAWTMAKVIGITKDKKGLVRIVQVKTRAGVFEYVCVQFANVLNMFETKGHMCKCLHILSTYRGWYVSVICCFYISLIRSTWSK